MEKYQQMKEFVSGALEYSKNKSEKTLNGLQKCLQILGISSDLSIFDPGSSVTTEFFVSLHELMSGLESRSSVLWCGIKVLQKTCHNPAARAELIHTYRFTPILSKLLGAHLIYEKKLKVLNLLQELTYGVKISWQEAYLRDLIPVLVQQIEGSEKEVVGLALGVLVNLCYKNLPAVYMLMRTVDFKQFLRTILKVQNDHMNTRVQVCKLLIILDNISGEIPDILNFIAVTFSTLGEAFKANNVFLMRHIVDFFKDVRSNEHYQHMLFKYGNYVSDSENLLRFIDNSSSDECVGMLFEFLEYLVTLPVAGMERLYLEIVSKALNWFRRPSSCTQSLQLVCSITMELRKKTLNRMSISKEFKLADHINLQLDNGLQELLMFLHTDGDQNFPADSGTQTRLTALMQLLQEMCRTPSLRQKILASVTVQVVRKVFAPLLGAGLRGGAECQPELVALYVHCLDFMSGLVAHDSTWLSCFSDLLNHQNVQLVLAVALYTGPINIRHKVLALTSTLGFPTESLSLLAKSLCDLEPLVLIPSSKSRHVVVQGEGQSSAISHDMRPLFNLAQEQRLDQLIAQLKGLVERNEIQDMATSSVMELYEYKLAAMAHTERALLSSLEAANNHATHLQHRVAQLAAEIGKHHQLLYQSQQCVEGLREEKAAILQRLQESQALGEKGHNELLEEIKRRKAVVNELNNTIDDQRKALVLKENELQSAKNSIEILHSQEEETRSQLISLESSHKELLLKHSELTKVKVKLEERISKRERLIQERESELNEFRKQNDALKTELNNLNMVNKMHEKSIHEKDSELHQLTMQLTDLERMRSIIFEVTSGQRKFEKS